MSMIAKLGGVVTVFGALNWAALGFFHKDVLTVLGQTDSAVSQALFVVTALGAMFMLALVAKPKKD
jgi:uncharacterized membrane protein YuzA (DUF378 family)